MATARACEKLPSCNCVGSPFLEKEQGRCWCVTDVDGAPHMIPHKLRLLSAHSFTVDLQMHL